MLDLLAKYARAHNLDTEPGFKPKEVRWAVCFEENGKYIGVVPLNGKEPKSGREFSKCPDLSQPELKFLSRTAASSDEDADEIDPADEMATDGDENYGDDTQMAPDSSLATHFLITECSNLAFLHDKDADPDDKTRSKHAFFTNCLTKAAGSLPSLEHIAQSLEHDETLNAIRADLKKMGAKAVHKVTLRVDDSFVVEDLQCINWWRAYRKDLRSKMTRTDAPKRICFATGDLVTPEQTHPKITGLSDVGGTAQAPLIGFNKEAYRSYNLIQSENAAVSEIAAYEYRAALDNLLKRAPRIAGMKVAHWFSHNVPIEDDPISYIVEPASVTEASALTRSEQLLLSIRTGERSDLANSRYYALSLSGASGRVMTRDWMEGAFKSLVENVAAWFGDLAIVNYRGVNLAQEPRIERIITCPLAPLKSRQKYKDWIKPVGATRTAIWRAATHMNTLIPSSVLGQLLAQHRSFVQTLKLEEAVEGGKNAAEAISRLHERMGLLKAYHNRKNRPTGGYIMSPYLNEDHPDPAYHCGRLMSVLANLQETALGEVNAGVVQRFYAAASTTPALVIGRLTTKSQFHLNKLSSERPKLAFWYEGIIASICGCLKDRIPSTLSLAEQSLFALGYYQQMAWDRTKRPSTADNKEKTDAGTN